MYCYYTAKASWAPSEVMDDIGALISNTSTTVLPTLSASCNTSLTHINGTVVTGGWSLHDPDTGQTGRGIVLSAQDKDNLTTKFVNLFFNVTTFSVRTLDDWNASTNATTNASSQQNIAPVTSGIPFSLHIFATQAYILLAVKGAPNNHWGSFEVARDTVFLASASPQQPVCMTFLNTNKTGLGTNLCYLPRLKSPKTGATLLTTTSGLNPAGLGWGYVNASTGYNYPTQTTPLIDSSGAPVHQVLPMMFGYGDTTFPNMVFYGRIVGAGVANLAPCYARESLGGFLEGDLVTINGYTYMMLSPTYGLLVPLY